MIDYARKISTVCRLQCLYISKIIPITMLVFVNYAHFNKNAETLLFFFTLNLDKNTLKTMPQRSEWQTRLPYLQFPGSYHCLAKDKTT